MPRARDTPTESATMNASTASGDQRDAARFVTCLPIEIEGAPGCTRDISDTGAYVETEAIRDFGPMVELTLSYRAQGAWRTVRCDAQVVRVEARGDRLGIAVRLAAPLFDDGETIDLGIARRH
jgi:hypothetical protein